MHHSLSQHRSAVSRSYSTQTLGVFFLVQQMVGSIEKISARSYDQIDDQGFSTIQTVLGLGISEPSTVPGAHLKHFRGILEPYLIPPETTEF